MKKVKILAALLMAAALIFAGCKNDVPDEDEPIEQGPVKTNPTAPNGGGSGNEDNTPQDTANDDEEEPTDTDDPIDNVKWENAVEFKILEAKIVGAGIQIKIDSSNLNLKWAEDLENVKPQVSLSEGTLSEAPGASFIAPVSNAETGVVENFVLQAVLTTPVQNTTVKALALIKNVTYKTTVSFLNGLCIPADYVPTALVLDKSTVELACGASTTFTAKDSTYGIAQEVKWELVDDTTGSSITSSGKFSAGEVDESTTVTVRATLKANEEVSVEATVTINPEKADVSSVYSARIYNEENNGAWFHGELSWEDSNYKVVEVSSKSTGIQGILNVAPANEKTTFQINLTSGEFRGVTKTFVFRVKTEGGAYYDVSITYSDTNVTASGSTTTITAISIEDAVLNPKLSLETDSVQVKAGSQTDVKIIGEDIDVSAVEVSVSSADTVSADVSGSTLKVTGKEKGEATVTVSYSAGETELSAELSVTVIGTDEKIVINWDAIDWLGGTVNNKYKATGNVKNIVNVQNPNWTRDNVSSKDGIYINSYAGISACSLGSDLKEFFIQGAGILVYLENFKAKETTFTITDAAGVYEVTVFYADGT